MKILFDTSILVEIDRHNENIIHFLKNLFEQQHDFFISTVTVAEILTGSYLRRDIKTSTLSAKEVLNQFQWKDVDGETAEAAAQLYSFLIGENKHQMVEYQDVLIGATFISARCDALITLNKKDFIQFPKIKNQVYTPDEFIQQKQ